MVMKSVTQQLSIDTFILSEIRKKLNKCGKRYLILYFPTQRGKTAVMMLLLRQRCKVNYFKLKRYAAIQSTTKSIRLKIFPTKQQKYKRRQYLSNTCIFKVRKQQAYKN